jgi:hypothetical protein
VIKAKKKPKTRLRVVVELFCGSVQSIEVDRDDVELDVVVLEDEKYVTRDDRGEVKVAGGSHDGLVIYTRHGSTRIGRKDLKPVLAAAQQYAKQKREEE